MIMANNIKLKMVKRLWNKIPLSDYWRWVLAGIIVKIISPFVSGGEVLNAYARESRWQLNKIKPPYRNSSLFLTKQDKPDIYIWAVIDWHYRMQRPQHIARELSKYGYRVFYISTTFINANKPGFELESLSEKDCIYNVRLYLKNRPAIYEVAASLKEKNRLVNSIKKLLGWAESNSIISIIEHPYWLAGVSRLPNSRLVYDCMDHHEGFDNTGKDFSTVEEKLFNRADAVIVTSDVLYEAAHGKNNNIHIIRNACDYHFLSTKPNVIYKDEYDRTIIGYYGAIADWIDIALLEKIAISFNDCLLLLIGADTCGAKKTLAHLSNVSFIGEVPYKQLPFYLHAIDVCLIPFKIIPLTLATNPVKIYEYFSAGKPVVTTALPELIKLGDIVSVANDHHDFISKIRLSIGHINDIGMQEQRQAFACQHTWSHRVTDVENVLNTLPNPLLSIIVVTYNNLELTTACLNSIDMYSRSENIEIIVVDNASTDDTPAYLTSWMAASNERHIILNVENKGFAAANNQGLAMARGDYLVLLNNDTMVTPGWLRTLINHFLTDSSIGMIGPVTNNIGNEARIKLKYKNSDEMYVKAKEYTLNHMGEYFYIRTLAFFCAMMTRAVYEKVGALDEAYGLGFFEDDDYCRRIQAEGWQLACADDVFVYHRLSASFNKLGDERKALFEKNKKIYESKWGAWHPHQYR